MLPNKTLTYKGKKCFGGKHSKERLTVLLYTNSECSEKFPPLVIGKSRQPQCFKNISKKPCEYQNNRKFLKIKYSNCLKKHNIFKHANIPT